MICIDLGNDTTKVAICRPGSPKQYPITPVTKIKTSILFANDGNVSGLGEDADEQLTSSNIRLYNRGFKNQSGSKSPVVMLYNPEASFELSASDIMYKFLETIRGKFEKECLLKDLNAITITTPANLSPAQASDLKKAAEWAGFGEAVLLPEAVAAGYCFASESSSAPKDKNILVVDWGDSALKLALLVKDSWGQYALSTYHKMMAYCGGGAYCDALCEFFMRDADLNENDLCVDLELCIRLSRKIRCAMEQLASREVVNVKLALPSASYLSSIASTTLEKIILDRAGAVERDVGDFIKQIPEERKPQKVLLCGGFFRNRFAKASIASILPGVEVYDFGNNFLDSIVIGAVRFAHESYNRRISQKTF